MDASQKRRSMIKTAIIIFLAVMLILTFFSNTIMNRSLPEVAAQYARSGSITAKLRVSAVVEANSKQTVKIEESRKVKSVAVRDGQDVKVGDVLFYLDDGESEELTAARTQLASLERQMTLLTLELGESFYEDELAVKKKQEELNEAIDRLNSVSGDNSYVVKLKIEREGLVTTQKTLSKQIAAYKAEISKLESGAAGSSLMGESTADRLSAAKLAYDRAQTRYVNADNRLKSAENEFEKAKINRDAAQKYYNSVTPDGSADIDAIEEQISNLRKSMKRDEEDYDIAVEKLEATAEISRKAYLNAKNEYRDAKSEYNKDTTNDEAYEAMIAAKKRMDDAEAAYEEKLDSVGDQIDALTLSYERSREDDEEALDKLIEKRDALADVSEAYDALETAKDAYDEADEALTEAKGEFSEAEAELSETKAEYEALVKLSSVEEYETTLSGLEAQYESVTERISDIDDELSELGDTDEKTLNAKVEALREELSTMRYNLNRRYEQAGINQKKKQLEIETLTADIEKQKELVKKYEANSTDAKIVAEVAGQVTSLTVANGSETSAGQTLCEVIVSELGYSCEISLTKEQAQRVAVGTAVEVTNSWWSNVSGTVASIRNDPKNPGTMKIAVIALNGDVVQGQNLNLTIGEKGQTYDALVPNSAVREDNNGKFVLVVEAKASPLGNRYIARRYDVEVLASDDTNSAVSGLLGSEFIITTSSSPIVSGNQVRLVEG